MPAHNRILKTFIDRLISTISQSPLLKTRISKTGRLLDCQRLNNVKVGLPRELLLGVVENHQKVSIHLDLRGLNKKRTQDENPNPLFASLEEDGKIDEQIGREHIILYNMFEKGLRRQAELVKRETGRHCLFIGYPLLYVASGERDILAPIFLWPISIEVDYHRQGRIFIGRAKEQREPIPPQFNRVMSNWLRREENLQLHEFSEQELAELNWEGVKANLKNISTGFGSRLSEINCENDLEPIPTIKALNRHHSPRLFNAAVLGYFRWQNESILADLEALKNKEECGGIVAGFVSGVDLEKPRENVSPPPEIDRYLVSDADFSQEMAIWNSRNSPGLVVHGPPGTGKSQTIVNIIADALAHERTVLMVCQKQAATRVVLERLRAGNLANLCLEVHDAETDRLQVFKAIRNQIDNLENIQATQCEQERSQLANLITERETCLDNFAKALHECNLIIGLSFRQMKIQEGKLTTAFPAVRPLNLLPDHLLGDLTANQLSKICKDILDLGKYYHGADYFNNPWRYRQSRVQNSPILRAEVTATLNQLLALDKKHMLHIQNYDVDFPLPHDISSFISNATQMVERLTVLFSSQEFLQVTLNWFNASRVCGEKQIFFYVEKCNTAYDIAQKVSQNPLDFQWSQACSALSINQVSNLQKRINIYCKYHNCWWRFLYPSFFSAKWEIQKFLPESESKREKFFQSAESLLNYLNILIYRDKLALISQELVPNLNPPRETFQQVQFIELAKNGLEIATWFIKYENSCDWIKQCMTDLLNDPNQIENIIKKLKLAIDRANIVQEIFNGIDRLEQFFSRKAFEALGPEILSGKSIEEWLKLASSGLGKLQPLIAYDSYPQKNTIPLGKILEAFEDYEKRKTNGDGVPLPVKDLTPEENGKWWSALLEYTTLQIWQEQCRNQATVLDQVTPEIHDRYRRELKELLVKKREIEAKVINERWLRKQLLFKDRPWRRMFQQRSSNLSKAKRLREAVEISLPNGLLSMRPCWLVNPEAAAQIFPLVESLFDVVIFDEASQCPIEQAIPAIARGKILVVAGDEKQLPPTEFFSARTDDVSITDEGEEYEATDEPVKQLENINRRFGEDFLLQVDDLLKAAIANLPEKWLCVHYRSEHPDLIEFSNRAFYEGRLEAPPSRLAGMANISPITYHQVGGLYLKRTNRDEALKVVQILKDFWLSASFTKTIGIVTFNRPQRDLIEDFIEEACERNDAFRVRFEQEINRKTENNLDVGFFVKNLENVQGDERDIMIFSTTFGKGSDGRFFRRFGPLGSVGGERRLNVAITRAKSQVILVGSMPIQEISDTLQAKVEPGTGITPAGFLQLYLAYAKAISSGHFEERDQILNILKPRPGPNFTQVGPESPFEEEVLEWLEKQGYKAHCQVGESGFRIDLCVLNPETLHGYILGIECDGATYHSDRSARIRDVWREEILRERGWRIHRIWSTRWWYERASEEEKLKYALFEAMKGNS